MSLGKNSRRMLQILNITVTATGEKAFVSALDTQII